MDGKADMARNRRPDQCTLFRWHRGGLSESMATATPCTSLVALVSILRQRPKYERLTTDRVGVEFYARDERIGWASHIVTVDGNAVGFTNGPLQDNQ